MQILYLVAEVEADKGIIDSLHDGFAESLLNLVQSSLKLCLTDTLIEILRVLGLASLSFTTCHGKEHKRKSK